MKFWSAKNGTRKFTRAFAAIMAALLMIDAVTTYGGIGVNLLFLIRVDGLTTQEVLSHQIIGVYSAATTILLIFSAILLFVDINDRLYRFATTMRPLVLTFLCALASLHVLAMMNVVSIPDLELKGMFIDGTIWYALITMGIVGLLCMVHWLRPRQVVKNTI